MQRIVPAVSGELIDARPVPGAAIVPRNGLAAGFHIRQGTADDLPWVDAMQKAQSREVGFLPRMALEGKVRLGQVLVAEGDGRQETGDGQMPEDATNGCSGSDRLLSPVSRLLPLAYLIAADRYFRRDEVGYVTQINVRPEWRRSLVAAALLRAQFERSAYGCRLYCCWCAQDLRANEFWEAMGFVPIAFRTGSRTKGRKGTPRMHIFWQKRIREGDDVTPYWYPSQTGGGELREDRLVFPIPPGVSWRDVLPVVLPEGGADDATTTATRHDREGVRSAQPMSGAGGVDHAGRTSPSAIALPDGRASLRVYPKGITERDGFLWRGGKRLMTHAMIVEEQDTTPNGLWFIPDDAELVEEADLPRPRRAVTKGNKPPAAKLDPRMAAMARELRDRWFERPDLVALPAARHDVRRAVEAGGTTAARPLLEAA